VLYFPSLFTFGVDDHQFLSSVFFFPLEINLMSLLVFLLFLLVPIATLSVNPLRHLMKLHNLKYFPLSCKNNFNYKPQLDICRTNSFLK